MPLLRALTDIPDDKQKVIHGAVETLCSQSGGLTRNVLDGVPRPIKEIYAYVWAMNCNLLQHTGFLGS